MELIKSSRLEYIKKVDDLVNGKIVKNTYYFNNYKASVFRQSKNERFVAIYINDKNTGTDTQASSPFIPVSYDKKHNDKSEDELIEDYLENTRKQNKDITINVIQKTWDNEAPPIERDYGGSSNIYYLNNGSTIQINWTSTQLSGETNAHEFIGVTVSYPYSLFEETIFGPSQPVGGKRWSNNGKELEIPNDTPKLQNYTTFFPTTTTASVPYGSKNFDLETGLPMDGYQTIPYYAANAKQVKNHVISKRIVIQEPSDVGNPEPILILDDGTFKKSSEVEESIIAAGASGGSASSILVEKVYPGGVTDLQIIKQVRDNWVKSAEPYGELDVCNPNNEFCRIIDYKSPLSDDPITEEDKIPSSDNPPTGTQSVDLSVVLPEDLDAIVRTDIGTIKIYIGEPFDPFVDAFVFKSDGFDDSDLLQDELEREFSAQEEEAITIKNETTDDPIGPSDNDFSNDESGESGSFVETESSKPGPGPKPGSKLFTYNKKYKVYYLINLAGHRLKLVISDLEKYLNANGYPGTKLESNGVMRDLEASAYPSSPARATASLHGAGLAIDLKFKIPGKSWSGISDNKNLAADAKLNKTIMSWVKSQGDLTWGGQWGKSKPDQGLVQGWGITEYHHFEIRANKIPEYWKPVESELKELGFKPSELVSPGKGTKLHKLMQLVIDSQTT